MALIANELFWVTFTVNWTDVEPVTLIVIPGIAPATESELLYVVCSAPLEVTTATYACFPTLVVAPAPAIVLGIRWAAVKKLLESLVTEPTTMLCAPVPVLVSENF